MNKPLPTGTISLDDAVERTARHEHPELNVVYRVEGGEAWRKLCGFAEKGRGGARMVTKSGFVMTVYRAQFIGFKDRYWKFASVLRYPPNDKGVPEEIERFPSYDLLDESLNPHRNASLVFLESELEVALAGRATRAGERASRPPAPDQRRGRPPAIDYAMFDAEVARLMDHHGDFSPDDIAWNCQARLESTMTDFVETTFRKSLTASTVRKHVSRAIAKLKEINSINGH